MPRASSRSSSIGPRATEARTGRTAQVTGLDEAAWIDVYEALEKPLYNVVYRWLWDAAESQDVVQEAFLRCWRSRERIRPDSVKALVYKTALRLASNQRRRKRLWRFVPLDAAPELADPMSGDGAAPVSKPLREAVDGLPEHLKRVLLLSELAGLSYREIADVTGVREGTVGSRRSRALALLRRRLAARGVELDEDES